MKHIFFKIGFICTLIIIGVIAVNSCKKKEPDTETQSSVDNSIAEGEYSRIAMPVNSIAVGDSGVQKGIFIPVPHNGCPDYWIDSTDIANGFPVTMWITYGQDTNSDGNVDIGCVDNDGKIRKGVIKAVFNSPWGTFPASMDMYLDSSGGYWVNNIRYKGKISVTKNSPASFHQIVTGGECWTSDWNIKWNCDRTLTVYTGDIANPNDDYSLVSGTASGTNRKGKDFSVEITNPLRREMGCRWIVSGTMTIKHPDLKDRTVDFGDGTCDDRATVTIDGNTFEFHLQ